MCGIQVQTSDQGKITRQINPLFVQEARYIQGTHKVVKAVSDMVSPNRHSHIVAPHPETRMYGRKRNITQVRRPTSTPPTNRHLPEERRTQP
ncbi:hypothetical protein C8Q78DRAFT_1001883 [Trametes maxima]|nr:hypothetical protein C8Q78DRAFT_1001883 [Trametes maxima]